MKHKSLTFVVGLALLASASAQQLQPGQKKTRSRRRGVPTTTTAAVAPTPARVPSPTPNPEETKWSQKRKTPAAVNAPAKPVPQPQNVSAPPVQQQQQQRLAAPPQVQARVQPQQLRNVPARMQPTPVPQAQVRANSQPSAVMNRNLPVTSVLPAAQNRAPIQSAPNTAAGQPQPAAQTVAVARLQNAQVVNNWSSGRFNAPQYNAFHNYHRLYHDHNWWRTHYNRITFFGGAPYYWEAGYWYPAWGFYEGYNFAYDGPFYAWHDLPPQKVVPEVQRALANRGYYPGAIDGDFGPLTRQSLAAWQRDHGLAVSSAIDQPTLASLGLG